MLNLVRNPIDRFSRATAYIQVGFNGVNISWICSFDVNVLFLEVGGAEPHLIPRKWWLCPDITEKLSSGMLNHKTNLGLNSFIWKQLLYIPVYACGTGFITI